jgi:hypothetical protein
MFKVTLELNDKTFRAKGETILEALKALKKPEFFKTTGVIRVTDGKKRTERVLNILKLKSLFNDNQDIYRQVMARNLTLFLK